MEQLDNKPEDIKQTKNKEQRPTKVLHFLKNGSLEIWVTVILAIVILLLAAVWLMFYLKSSDSSLAEQKTSSRTANQSYCSPNCTHVDVLPKALTDSASATYSRPTTEVAPSLYCSGSGSDGSRVQVVYAYASDGQNRINDVKSRFITPYVAAADEMFRTSAAQTGGYRQVRWLTNSSCELDVQVLQLPVTYAQYIAMDNNQVGLMFNRIYGGTNWDAQAPVNRRYAIFSDVEGGIFNNVRGGFAWGGAYAVVKADEPFPTPLQHELMHAMGTTLQTGAVGPSAPHTTLGGHCTDGLDIMCYADFGDNARYYTPTVCSIAYYDCNHDDYFYAGTPPAGSFLATQPSFNTANSPFLATSPPVPPQPPNPVPANNNFASATNIASPAASQINGSNVNSTAETGEPSHAGNLARRSIWYKFTPSTTGTYVIKTFADSGASSSFNTVLGVYKRGPTAQFNGLVSVASNDDFNGKIQSKVTITGTAAKTYWIAIDGKNGATGTTVLQIRKQ